MSLSCPKPLIRVDALAGLLGRRTLRVIDVRHDLLHADAGRAAWLAGHIPGAVHLHLDDDLAGPTTGHNGRHPLPDPLECALRLGAAGIGEQTHVVVYDDAGGAFAARLWWMLRWLGHDAVSVLDGGWQAWCAAGLPAHIGPEHTPGEVFVPRPRDGWIVGVSDIASGSWQVVDARAPERFRGEIEPIDPVAGHIPGAVNRFHRNNLDETGCFKPPAILRTEFEALLGGRPASALVSQCGSGVTACHNLLAMAVAGIDGARLYPGSWSEWCSDPQRPVARGES